MKATELRIGNLVEYKITDDLDERIEWWEVSEIDADDLKTIDDDEDYRPIPLTEEWHNKFGVYKNGFNSFEYEINDFSSFGIKIIVTEDYVFLRQGNKKNMHEDDVVSIWNKDLTKRNMYVHEFQNLYFALTGEELTL